MPSFGAEESCVQDPLIGYVNELEICWTFISKETALERSGGQEGSFFHIRAMKSKWASVSSDGRLTMDSSILEFRDGLCDYIIVHELLHLKVRNHGRLFKSLMHVYLPGWEKLERELGVCKF